MGFCVEALKNKKRTPTNIYRVLTKKHPPTTFFGGAVFLAVFLYFQALLSKWSSKKDYCQCYYELLGGKSMSKSRAFYFFNQGNEGGP
jgi:hypothetical protein